MILKVDYQIDTERYYMKTHIRNGLPSVLLGGWIGTLFLCLQPGIAMDSRFLAEEEIQSSVGGACPDSKCANETCANTGCTPQEVFCEKVNGTTKCRKTLKNNFARCTLPGKSKGFSCEETSVNGCVTIKVGDQVANKCLEAYCSSDSGTCGSTRYNCRDKACE